MKSRAGLGIAIILMGSLAGVPMNSGIRCYIPEAAPSMKDSKVVLEYSSDAGSNRPYAGLKFKDGFQIELNAVCEGDYAWCIRIWEGGVVHEVGSLKMVFHDDGILEIKTRIHHDKTFNKFHQHLDLLPGRYKLVHSPVSEALPVIREK